MTNKSNGYISWEIPRLLPIYIIYPLVIPLVLKHEKEKSIKIHHLVPCIAAINLRFVEDFDAKKTCLMTRQGMCLVIDDRPAQLAQLAPSIVS